MNLSLLDFLILALATWRTAHLAVNEDAPFRLMARIRARWMFGGALNCVYCMSIWTAALMLALWLTPLQPVVIVAAVSGAALMLRSYTGVNHP